MTSKKPMLLLMYKQMLNEVEIENFVLEWFCTFC